MDCSEEAREAERKEGRRGISQSVSQSHTMNGKGKVTVVAAVRARASI